MIRDRDVYVHGIQAEQRNGSTHSTKHYYYYGQPATEEMAGAREG
jgi:hypothetical protein